MPVSMPRKHSILRDWIRDVLPVSVRNSIRILKERWLKKDLLRSSDD